jgi:hypothetical protein
VLEKMECAPQTRGNGVSDACDRAEAVASGSLRRALRSMRIFPDGGTKQTKPPKEGEPCSADPGTKGCEVAILAARPMGSCLWSPAKGTGWKPVGRAARMAAPLFAPGLSKISASRKKGTCGMRPSGHPPVHAYFIDMGQL